MLKDLLFVVPPNMSLRDLPKWAATAGRFRKWTGRDIHEIVRLFTMSAADFLDEWFEDERVKGALATQAIIGAWCGPMTPGSRVRPDAPLDRRGRRPRRRLGMGRGAAWAASPQAMARAAEAAGAEIRTDAEVDRVAINASGRAVGVELADGSLVRAQRVVSCAHPITTYLDLVGEERLPDDVVRDVKRYRSRSGLGEAERRAVRAAGVPVVGPGRRRSTRGWSPSRRRSSTSSGRGTTRSTDG